MRYGKKVGIRRKPVRLIGLVAICTILLALADLSFAQAAEQKVYVGSEVCGECHDENYENYIKSSKKAHSFDKVMKIQRRNRLSRAEYKECLACHTTGYGQPGGFVSETETPDLKNAGCEVCHGPGSVHVESQEAEDINGELDISLCLDCHNDDRVMAFGFRPLLRGGGH